MAPTLRAATLSSLTNECHDGWSKPTVSIENSPVRLCRDALAMAGPVRRRTPGRHLVIGKNKLALNRIKAGRSSGIMHGGCCVYALAAAARVAFASPPAGTSDWMIPRVAHAYIPCLARALPSDCRGERG